MIKNYASFTTEDLYVVFGNACMINIDSDFRNKGVSTDSRTIEPENIFVAIRGDRYDGHDKVAEAYEQGASAAIVDKIWYKENKLLIEDKPAIIVDDTLDALGALAYFHRLRFDYPVIAIAGSNGKTTTKDMTAHVLSQKYNVLKTYLNYNNRIGVPLVLFTMNNDYDMGVIEIGTNQPGEIAILSEVAAPTHGLITNISEEHLEFLIDLVGVELEETYLFGYLRKKNGMVFLNHDDDVIRRYGQLIEKKETYGLSDGVSCKGDIILNDNLNPTIDLEYHGNQFTANLSTVGYSSALNALAAATVGLHFDMSGEEIRKALESYKPDDSKDFGRMRLEKAGSLRIINDSYNANPASMENALNTLQKYASSKKTAVLGDMLELGQISADRHKKALEHAANCADIVLTFGDEFYKAAKRFDSGKIKPFNDKTELLNELKKHLKPEDVILVKGSRGMRMEEIVKMLKDPSGFFGEDFNLN